MADTPSILQMKSATRRQSKSSRAGTLFAGILLKLISRYCGKRRARENRKNALKAKYPDRPAPVRLQRDVEALHSMRQDDARGEEFSDVAEQEDNEGDAEEKQDTSEQTVVTSEVNENQVQASDILSIEATATANAEATLSADLQQMLTRPSSQIAQRRIGTARMVAMDGKFYSFTRRPCTSSSIGISLRTPAAPMEGTEEEHSVLRMITSQGKEFELVAAAKKTDKYSRVGMKPRPTKSHLGAYTVAMEYSKPTDRETLLNRVVYDVPTAAPPQNSGSRAMDITAEREALKKVKTDMVRDRRSRFVDGDIIPPRMEMSFAEKFHREQEKAEAESRAAAELAAQEAQRKEKGGKKKEALSPVIRRVPQKPIVHYGKGRLTSTHNMHGRIEEPWSTATGRYATVPGDRTA